MKKYLFCLIVLLLCFGTCSCGEVEDAERTNELSEKYSFYTSSVNSIKTTTDLGNTAANDIFIILVEDCGIDNYFTLSKKDGYFSLNYGIFHDYKLYLDNNIVSSVYDGDKQIYPATAAAVQPEETEEAAATEAPEENTEAAPDVPHRTGEEIVGISDKDIADISLNFAGDVRNDVTGNWRYATTSENIDFEDYALSYYKEHFAADNEIHAIINFTRKITARMNCTGDMIFLSFFDYVDGEEHDAKQLFSGTPLADFIIYIDNGDIEKIVEE